MLFYIFLLAAFVVISVTLIIYAIKSFKKPESLGFYLGHTFVCALLVIWSYAINFAVNSENIMNIFCSLQHVFIDWTLYFSTAFMFKISGRKANRKFRLASVMVLAIDSVMLATNPINHFAADYITKTNEVAVYTAIRPKFFFYVHTVLCLMMIGTMIVSTVRKIFATASYYRLRYFMTIAMLVFIAGLNCIFTINENHVIDYSTFFYGVAALLFYFAAYDYTPIVLIRHLQKYLDDSITDATLLYDIDGNLLKSNTRAEELFGKEKLANLEAFLDECNISKEGKKLCIINDSYYEIRYQRINDAKDNYVAALFVCRDVTENFRQVEREHKAAIYDALTGCYNRLGFLEKAPGFFERNKTNGGYAVMVSGILGFKGINGLYGAKVGDRVLKEIARRFHDYHHEFPMLYARTAEGKFSCVLPFEYVDEIVNEMSRISIKNEDNIEINVEIFHGFVVMKDETKPLDYYYELSLLALSKCKKQMDLPALEYSDDMAKEQQRQQLLLLAMRDSIEKGEFFVELQPQIDLKENRVSGAEALVRWNHPTLGRISPGEFIPLFESNGFISKIDIFVWNQAAAIIKKLSDEGIYHESISVNVSQIDIMNIDVVKEFEEIIEKYSIPASKLHVEITESACADNREVLISTIEKLRAIGFVVEIDDFGSGYSSLNALMKIPFDVVKLDMMFMQENDKDAKNDVIMSAMAGMIHELKAKIVVEGVETEENVKCAVHLNGDAAQGYHYSKPVSVERFVEFLSNYS